MGYNYRSHLLSKTRRHMKIWLPLVFLIGTLPAAAQVDVAVVVNPVNSVNGLSFGELRKIFAGEKRSWSGGVPVKLLTRAPNTHEHDALLRLLEMSEDDYKQHWTSQIYKGEAQSEPITLPSNGMQKEALRLYPGAIALVEVKDVKPGMKVLKIDGRSPGEEGYRIH
jgi:ABC-type phosphate transport system substrate-binding protein